MYSPQNNNNLSEEGEEEVISLFGEQTKKNERFFWHLQLKRDRDSTLGGMGMRQRNP